MKKNKVNSLKELKTTVNTQQFESFVVTQKGQDSL
jgi:hypothetical protein